MKRDIGSCIDSDVELAMMLNKKSENQISCSDNEGTQIGKYHISQGVLPSTGCSI